MAGAQGVSGQKGLMMNKHFEKSFNNAITKIEAGFSSKVAKKSAQDDLNRAYNYLQEIHAENVRNWVDDLDVSDMAERMELIYSKAIPFNLHQWRDAKHADFVGNELLPLIQTLVELREQVKEAPLTLATDSATVLMKKAEKRAIKAVDDGFRCESVSCHQVVCYLSEYGTRYVRGIWYLDGQRTSFAKVAHILGERRAVWEAKGCPDMSNWGFHAVRAFYTVV